MEFIIEEMKPSDWEEVAKIYLEGIKTKIATFENEVPAWEKWDAGHCKTCRIIARSAGRVLGWAALSPTSDRCVYAGVAEISIYVGGQYKSSGVGTALMMELIRRSEEEGFWTLQSGIIKENESSRALHRKCGFREVGIRERLGQMDNGKWHDVVLMERRSKTVG
ncbi:MAG: N-acetyltransferase [Clostridiales bacterium]|nr:N-acetyltransferase [Clostridiales bacterium]